MRIAVLVAVAAMLVMAGCLSFPSGDEPDAPGETFSDSVTGSDPIEWEDPEFQRTEEELSGEETTLDKDELWEGHAEIIREAGSMTSRQVEFVASSETGSDAVRIRQTTRVDLDAGTAHHAKATLGIPEETYTTPDATYTAAEVPAVGDGVAQQESAEPPYDGAVQPVNTEAAMGKGLMPVNDVVFVDAGVETFQDRDVQRYEARGADAIKEQFSENVDDGITAGDVEDFHMVVLVGEDGLVHHFEWSIRVETEEEVMTYAYVQSITDVGDTVVEEPAWVTG